MTTFTIGTENSITALTIEEAAAGIPDGMTPFTSDTELQRLAADWPADRLVAIWNGIPGVRAVTRFTSRNIGVSRIWKAIQTLAPRDGQPREPKAPDSAIPAKTARPAKKLRATKGAAPVKKSGAKGSERMNKKAEVIAMMKRARGTTLTEIMDATGWQQHTVRGFVSILGTRGGQTIESARNAAGERTYRIPK